MISATIQLVTGNTETLISSRPCHLVMLSTYQGGGNSQVTVRDGLAGTTVGMLASSTAYNCNTWQPCVPMFFPHGLSIQANNATSQTTVVWF